MLILFLSLSFHHSLLVIPSLSLYPSSSHKYIAPPPTDLRAQFFFSLVVPSKYRISFLLSLSLSLSLLTVYTSFSGSTGTILFPSPRLSIVSDSRHARRFFFAALRPSSVYLCPSPVPRITVLLPPVESNNSFPFSPNRVPPRPIHGRPTRLSSFHVGWLSLLHPSLSLPWNQCTPEQRRERGLVGGLCRTPAAWPTHRNKFHPPTLPLTHFCRAIIRCELESRRVAYLAAGSPFLSLSLSHSPSTE